MPPFAPPILPDPARRDGRGAPAAAATSPEPFLWRAFALGLALATLAAASLESLTRKWECR